MANTFKNKLAANIGTSLTTVYTAPAVTTTTVIGMSIANTTVNTVKASVVVVDNSAAVTTYLIKEAPIPAGGSLVIIGADQKVVLETADYIRVQSDAAASLDVTMSMLEIT